MGRVAEYSGISGSLDGGAFNRRGSSCLSLPLIVAACLLWHILIYTRRHGLCDCEKSVNLVNHQSVPPACHFPATSLPATFTVLLFFSLVAFLPCPRLVTRLGCEKRTDLHTESQLLPCSRRFFTFLLLLFSNLPSFVFDIKVPSIGIPFSFFFFFWKKQPTNLDSPVASLNPSLFSPTHSSFLAFTARRHQKPAACLPYSACLRAHHPPATAKVLLLLLLWDGLGIAKTRIQRPCVRHRC